MSAPKNMKMKRCEYHMTRNAMLERIADAADALATYLECNCGDNDDWPVNIKVSGSEDANELLGLMRELDKSLKPYRERKI